jgi:parallel beta-helix repeat protein
MVSVFGVIIPTTTSAYTNHDPIYINGNAEFTSENGVTDGDGSESNPYIIESWDISASSTHGIEIRNTDAYLIIRNCSAYDGGSYYNGIYFYNVTNGRIENTISSNNYCGIRLYSSSYNNISNNSASNNFHGIRLYSSSYNNISNNNASNNWWGIYLCESSYNNIFNNNVNSNNYPGIQIIFSSYNSISNNSASNNSYGIYLWESSNSKIYNNNVNSNNWCGILLDSSSYNNISSNKVNSNIRDGIRLWSASNNNVLSSNSASNNDRGIFLFYSSNNIITNCDVLSNKGHGIYLCDSLNNEITNCDIVDNGVNGINLQFSTAEVNGNRILNNGWIKVPSWYYPAIFCYESSPTIKNNVISGNAWAAIECQYSSPLIDNNIITANYYYGVYFKYYCSPIIRNNEINDNWAGVWAESSTDSIIEGNGILMLCPNNKIFHNNFISNTIQVYGYGINQWDDGYPSGGNYWSDYSGIDDYSGPNQNISGSDGIGDTPYIVGENIRDNYPLMYPWGKPRISVEKEFIPSEIMTISQGVISAINITNIGNVNITSMTVIDEYVENMRPNDPAELLVTITSDEGQVYAIMPEDLDITSTENNITISFELPLWVLPVFWEDGKLRFREETYYLESIPKDWVVGVQYILYPITELEMGTYYANATVTAYSETGSSTTETATGILTVSSPIELAFPTN